MKTIRILSIAFVITFLSQLSLSAAGLEEVRKKIDQIICEQLPSGTDVAVMVYDLTDDTTLYAYRENIMCRPASVQKVITSIVALHSLGADYTFETSLRTQGQIGPDSILDGDLYLVGGIDPALSEHELRQMAADLKKAGVKQIKGTLYADISQMDSVYWGTGWCWDDSPASFQPYISPLMVHQGFIGVEVRPTVKGKAPEVSLYPANRFIKVENRALTDMPSLGGLVITRDWVNNDNTILVSGNSRRREAKDLSIVGSADFTFSLFRQYLEDEGIGYDKYGWDRCPTISVSLSQVSHSIVPIMKEALKESNNLFAEAMFLQMGRLTKPLQAGFGDASKFMDNFMARKFGFSSHQYNIVDGSGLSTYNYITPSFMIDLLKLMYDNENLFPHFYNSLPISGMDGTLKTRLNTKSTINRVRAKTGSLTGSCTLAGYLKTAGGHDIAFCIMNEGAIKTAPSKKVQDDICTVLCGLIH